MHTHTQTHTHKHTHTYTHTHAHTHTTPAPHHTKTHTTQHQHHTTQRDRVGLGGSLVNTQVSGRGHLVQRGIEKRGLDGRLGRCRSFTWRERREKQVKKRGAGEECKEAREAREAGVVATAANTQGHVCVCVCVCVCCVLQAWRRKSLYFIHTR